MVFKYFLSLYCIVQKYCIVFMKIDFENLLGKYTFIWLISN